MANIFKQMQKKNKIRKEKKSRAKAERKINVNADELTNYKNRLSKNQRKVLVRMGVVIVVLAVLVTSGILFFRNRTYSAYQVVSTSDQEDTVSSKYLEMDGALFKYSGEGAVLEDNEGGLLWNATYEMQNPIADNWDDTVVVADQGGTAMNIFDKNGLIGTVNTSLNIVKAKVASQGVVAAILEGGEDTWVNFYSTDGSLIAENQTRVDNPGYPMDIAISEDGVLIMVTYQFVTGEETTSYVAFYNFDSAGQNQIDNIVSGYQYQGVVTPQVEYLDATTSVAFRDDGFSVFKGRQVPKESTNVVVEQEIISTFHDSNNIGLVFKNDGQDQLYTMQVYNTRGRMKFEKDFNIAYNNIRMSDGQIVMNNDSQVCVITTSGVEKYNGTIDEGSINDFFKLGMNRYVLVLDNGLSTIKFN